MNRRITKRPRPRLAIRLAVPLTVAAALTAALLPGSGSARALVPPDNTTEPSISGQAIEGRTLTANPGIWSGSTPMTFTYRWLRCPTDGGAQDGIQDEGTAKYLDSFKSLHAIYPLLSLVGG
jgi:hypothetical protein